MVKPRREVGEGLVSWAFDRCRERWPCLACADRMAGLEASPVPDDELQASPPARRLRLAWSRGEYIQASHVGHDKNRER